MKSDKEHKFTSTGIKFWRHPEQMIAYFEGKPKTVISTHISPEGACNLKCPYCSVTYRKVSNRIGYASVINYVDQLMHYGLKAVILTGGGEPTLYPGINELIRYIASRGLKVAMITNGTQSRRIKDDVWKLFSWVRFSINIFDDWEKKIRVPYSLLNENCVIGSSFVYTKDHQNNTDIDEDIFRRVADLARLNRARYTRVLPNCLLPQDRLSEVHAKLDQVFKSIDSELFFHQNKNHRAPSCNTCHQSYFRPYLSEVPYKGIPGSVYPCDSVVLNSGVAHFSEKYQLCGVDRISDYMTGKIKHKFDPTKDCSGCVFTDTVEMLDRWKVKGVGKFSDQSLMHEEFV